MSQTGKATTLGQLVADIEAVLPALRELTEVQERLAKAKDALAAATTEADAAERICEQTVARCAGKIKAAEEQRDKLVAEAEAEAIRRSDEAREKHERWNRAAKAQRIREDAESAELTAKLQVLRETVEGKKKELDDMESKLSLARKAFRDAMTGVGV